MVNEGTDTTNEMARMADSYDSYMRKVTMGREHILRAMTVDLARIQAGDQVLEVGCGTGTLSLAAKQKVGAAGKVYGIDVLPQMIEISRGKAARAGADVTFQVASIDDLPFPDQQFDAVLCSFMIFHMPDDVRNKGIREIQRVLKPGGHLLVLDMALPANPVQRAIVKLLFGGFMKHDLRELLPVMAQAGFKDIERQPADFRVFFLSAIAYVRGRAGS